MDRIILSTYNSIRIHSLMIFSVIIEFNIDGDTTSRLLRRVLFMSKVKIEI